MPSSPPVVAAHCTRLLPLEFAGNSKEGIEDDAVASCLRCNFKVGLERSDLAVRSEGRGSLHRRHVKLSPEKERQRTAEEITAGKKDSSEMEQGRR